MAMSLSGFEPDEILMPGEHPAGTQQSAGDLRRFQERVSNF